MSYKKAWREFNYIKNDQSRDSQSSLSESRSMQSFRFSQVRFNKGKIQNQRNSKIFTLTNGGSRVKQFKNDSSFLQQSKRMKDNSILENRHQEPMKITIKTSNNCKLETKMKTFLFDIKKIHQEMKFFAENILVSFEKFKNQLQTNLLCFSDELLKLGDDTTHIEKVRQIFHQGFSEIRKSISILPSTLSKLSHECKQQLKENANCVSFQPQSRLLRFEPENPKTRFDSVIDNSISRTKMISKVNFAKKQGSGSKKDGLNFELPLTSHQKLKNRPSTERRQQNLLRSTSFEQNANKFINRKESITNNDISLSEQKGKQFEEVSKIDDIIFQMRIILNQSS